MLITEKKGLSSYGGPEECGLENSPLSVICFSSSSGECHFKSEVHSRFVMVIEPNN